MIQLLEDNKLDIKQGEVSILDQQFDDAIDKSYNNMILKKTTI